MPRVWHLQYHKGTLIDVRHDNGDGIPRGPHGEPKPWGSGEQDGDFRIEKLRLTDEEGEAYRASSVAHQQNEDNIDITDPDQLRDYVLKQPADWKTMLKGML